MFLNFTQIAVFVLSGLGLLAAVLMHGSDDSGDPIAAHQCDDRAFGLLVRSAFVLTVNAELMAFRARLLDMPAFFFVELCAIMVIAMMPAVTCVKAWIQQLWQSHKAHAALLPPASAKKPWFSKTIAFNAAIAAGLLAEANISSLQGVLPAAKYQIAAFALPIVNMLLRAYTSRGLSFKPAMPQAEVSQ